MVSAPPPLLVLMLAPVLVLVSVAAASVAVLATAVPRLVAEDMAKQDTQDNNNNMALVQQGEATPPLVENMPEAKVSLVMALAHPLLAAATVLVPRAPPMVANTRPVVSTRVLCQ